MDCVGIVPTVNLEQPSSKSLSAASPFLGLPAEIRNQSSSSPSLPSRKQQRTDKHAVYTLCLTNPTLHQLQRVTTRNHVAAHYLPPLNLMPSLLQTCHQIHTEALPILYGWNTFCAHPTLLTSFPFLLTKMRPVSCVANIKRIKRWYVQVRLDVNVGFSKAQVSDAFSGAEELEVEVWQPMLAEGDLAVLRLFEGVREVARAKVSGCVGRGYGAWLEGIMMADYGFVLGERPEEEVLNEYKVWAGF